MFGMAGSSSEGVQGSGVDLDNGTYYVKETKAPEGYEINDTLVKLLITDNGILQTPAPKIMVSLPYSYRYVE